MKQDNPQQADVIYAAGLFDGEGSTNIYKSKGYGFCTFAVSIWQTHLPVLEWMSETFGGHVYPRPGTNKLNWEWRIVGHGAYAFFKLIRPYSRIRYEKMDEVMWKWERRAAAETEWNNCPFDEKRTVQMRQSELQGMTEPAEESRNDSPA
jgi:hypothetical protein